MNTSVLSRLSFLVTLFSVVGQACAPQTPSSESPNFDADAGISFNCEVSSTWEDPQGAQFCDALFNAQNEAAATATETDKIPLIILVVWAVNVYRVTQVARTTAAVLRVAVSGGRTVALTREALYRDQATGVVTTIAGAVALTAADKQKVRDEIRAQVPRDANGVPTSLGTPTCRQAVRDRLYNYHDICDQGVPNNPTCAQLRTHVTNMRECMRRRKEFGDACFPNGGFGPMGSADAGHNRAWCSAARAGAHSYATLNWKYTANKCGAGFTLPPLVQVPRACGPY